MKHGIIFGINFVCFVSGCATTPEMTYWTQKDGVASIHHVTGKVDKVEKLTQSEFKNDKLDSGKHFRVEEAIGIFTMPTHPPGDNKLEGKVEKLTEEVESLKDRLRRKPEAKASKPKEPIDLHNAIATEGPNPAGPSEQQTDEQPRQSQ